MGVAVERTALGPTLIVAIDQYSERTLVPDPWAVRILPRGWRVPVVLSRSKAVTLVPVDLEHGDITASLTAAGFDTGMRAAFVWESVTTYLTEPVVRRTLGATSSCAAGNHLVFTHFRKDFVDGVSLWGAQKARKRFADKLHLWKFGIAPENVAGLLAEYGWHETEQVGASEYRKRYLAPAGRSDPVSEIERAVWARR